MEKLAQIDIGQTFLGGGMGGSHSPANIFRTLSGVGALVTLIVRISFIVAGLILLFYFILGGINLMQSAGESDPQKAEQSKKTLTSALIGFIVVFTSYWIVKLLGELFGIPNIV